MHPRSQRGEIVILGAIVGLPLVVLVAALAQATWYPTGDLAQAELRMLAMPSDPPLLGAAGRIADEAGRQGNHPGPLMFWVTWPLYVVLGRSSWAFTTATTLVNLAWLWTSVWLVRRLAGAGITFWYAAVALVLVGGFGLDALSQPWNPWVALMPFLVLVLAAARGLDGWRWAPVLGVAAASYSIQGHVGYAPVVLPVLALAVAGPLWHRWRSAGSTSAAPRPVGSAPEAAEGRRSGIPGGGADGEDSLPGVEGGPARPGTVTVVAPLVVAVAVGLAAWSGPLIDVWVHDPHNVDLLVANFSAPSEDPIGVREGLASVLRAADPFGAWMWGGLAIEGSVLPGAALVLGWAAVSLAAARRAEERSLDRLNLVLAVGWAAGLVAVSRIFGEVYLYVFRWIVVLVALTVFALGWGLWTLLADRTRAVAPGPARLTAGRRSVAMGIGFLVLLSGLTSARVAVQEIPYGSSWRMERELAPEVARRLDPDRRYLVEWDDRVYLGGLAFGLILDLERRGFDVGGPPSAVAGIGRHRVRCGGGDHDAVLTVVTGPLAIETWVERDDAQMLARTGPTRAGFEHEAAVDELARALATAGQDWDRAQIERAMTMLVLSSDLGPEINRLAGDIVAAGVPTAVFVQDPAPARPPMEPGPTTESCP